ncbi:GNAT family N-acetyltransferase [Shewanella acanthi]|uniref:GNAT family N-acetyltransferase n=1 Tax=Shewanella acanthi TaxID=2864212 RepID=UPI001C6591B8|nr:N-acetyltransferase [Shewanella acanthi]QYJ79706.1 N-acetyltransferase [Shewanella acanthi]
MSLIIRAESPFDIGAIHALTKTAFLDAPHTAHTEHFIVDALRDAGALTISLVAEVDGSLVGHVAISPVSISSGVSNWYGLGPISVLPERQKQGIGSNLMLSALQQLKAKGALGCVLVGDPAYYSRFGFVHQNNLTYPDLPAEFFLCLSFSQSVPRGIATFHEAFSAKG